MTKPKNTESEKEVIASVEREMKLPRLAQSVREDVDGATKPDASEGSVKPPRSDHRGP